MTDHGQWAACHKSTCGTCLIFFNSHKIFKSFLDIEYI